MEVPGRQLFHRCLDAKTAADAAAPPGALAPGAHAQVHEVERQAACQQFAGRVPELQDRDEAVETRQAQVPVEDWQIFCLPVVRQQAAAASVAVHRSCGQEHLAVRPSAPR